MSNEDVWYPLIEDLFDYSKIQGGKLDHILTIVYEHLKRMKFETIPLVKTEKYLGTAVGDDLDKVGSIVNMRRFPNEPDLNYRARIFVLLASLERNTIPAIQNAFEYLSGQIPEIREYWETKIYNKGDPIQNHDRLAEFWCVLPYFIGHVREIVSVIDDGSGNGNTVQCKNEGITTTSFDSPNGAWLETDRDHDTNLYQSHDLDGLVTLISSYPAGTRIEVEYDIDNQSTWSLDNYESYNHILAELTAAGVSSVLEIDYRLREWIYGDEESVGVIVELKGFGVGLTESITPPTNTYISGSGHWGIGHWGQPETKWGAAGYVGKQTKIIKEY